MKFKNIQIKQSKKKKKEKCKKLGKINLLINKADWNLKKMYALKRKN